MREKEESKSRKDENVHDPEHPVFLVFQYSPLQNNINNERFKDVQNSFAEKTLCDAPSGGRHSCCRADLPVTGANILAEPPRQPIKDPDCRNNQGYRKCNVKKHSSPPIGLGAPSILLFAPSSEGIDLGLSLSHQEGLVAHQGEGRVGRHGVNPPFHAVSILFCERSCPLNQQLIAVSILEGMPTYDRFQRASLGRTGIRKGVIPPFLFLQEEFLVTLEFPYQRSIVRLATPTEAKFA